MRSRHDRSILGAMASTPDPRPLAWPGGPVAAGALALLTWRWSMQGLAIGGALVSTCLVLAVMLWRGAAALVRVVYVVAIGSIASCGALSGWLVGVAERVYAPPASTELLP